MTYVVHVVETIGQSWTDAYLKYEILVCPVPVSLPSARIYYTTKFSLNLICFNYIHLFLLFINN